MNTRGEAFPETEATRALARAIARILYEAAVGASAPAPAGEPELPGQYGLPAGLVTDIRHALDGTGISLAIIHGIRTTGGDESAADIEVLLAGETAAAERAANALAAVIGDRPLYISAAELPSAEPFAQQLMEGEWPVWRLALACGIVIAGKPSNVFGPELLAPLTAPLDPQTRDALVAYGMLAEARSRLLSAQGYRKAATVELYPESADRHLRVSLRHLNDALAGAADLAEFLRTGRRDLSRGTHFSERLAAMLDAFDLELPPVVEDIDATPGGRPARPEQLTVLIRFVSTVLRRNADEIAASATLPVAEWRALGWWGAPPDTLTTPEKAGLASPVPLEVIAAAVGLEVTAQTNLHGRTLVSLASEFGGYGVRVVLTRQPDAGPVTPVDALLWLITTASVRSGRLPHRGGKGAGSPSRLPRSMSRRRRRRPRRFTRHPPDSREDLSSRE